MSAVALDFIAARGPVPMTAEELEWLARHGVEPARIAALRATAIRRSRGAARRRLAEAVAGIVPAGRMNHRNHARAELYALADYYAWSARRGHLPCGNDPRTGRPWPMMSRLGRAIGRAENLAAARVTYAAARAYPNPLEAI